MPLYAARSTPVPWLHNVPARMSSGTYVSLAAMMWVEVSYVVTAKITREVREQGRHKRIAKSDSQGRRKRHR